MNLPPLKFNLKSILDRPMLIGTVIVVVVAAWSLWMVYGLLVDQPLASDKVSAQQLRANTVQLQTYQSTLNAYQHPETPGSWSTFTPFAPIGVDIKL